MEVIVRKPTDQEKEDMKKRPTWSCDVSTFDWFYDQEERCLLIKGEVTVEYDGKSVNSGAGDYVVFPKGLSCVWKVTKAVEKHYLFQ